jgi:hypothetical protein
MTNWPATEQLKQLAREDVGMLILERLTTTEAGSRHLLNSRSPSLGR